jgi:hypothetical protein
MSQNLPTVPTPCPLARRKRSIHWSLHNENWNLEKSRTLLRIARSRKEDNRG